MGFGGEMSMSMREWIMSCEMAAWYHRLGGFLEGHRGYEIAVINIRQTQHSSCTSNQNWRALIGSFFLRALKHSFQLLLGEDRRLSYLWDDSCSNERPYIPIMSNLVEVLYCSLARFTYY